MTGAIGKTIKARYGMLLGVVAVGSLPLQQVFAQVSCGDTVTSNTVLTADLSCSTAPALNVEGPARLDLNGFTVSCEDSSANGIVLRTTNASVSNGRVSGCDVGVLASSPARNPNRGLQISKIVADSNRVGIGVLSARSQITDNVVTNSIEYGIYLVGNLARQNRVVNNSVSGDGNFNDLGIYLSDGASNNDIINNESRGLLYGILTDFGADGNKLVRNVTPENFYGIGVFTNDNNVVGNVSENNSINGIETEGENNAFSGNQAVDNGVYDLQDYGFDCGTSSWRGNIFNSGDPDCIR